MKLFFARCVLIATWCVCFPLRGPVFVLQDLVQAIRWWRYKRAGVIDLDVKYRLLDSSRVSPWVRPMVVHAGTWKHWLLSCVSAWCWTIEHKPTYEQKVQELRKGVADLLTKVNELKEQKE